jgi:hypothetical protein
MIRKKIYRNGADRIFANLVVDGSEETEDVNASPCRSCHLPSLSAEDATFLQCQ